jgi:hypothetical protein
MSWSKWAKSGGRLDEPSEEAQSHSWYAVIWLTGVDYFSTLGYQPGIALLAAGALSPIATAILVAVTLLCAFPVYAQVSARSYVGQGSIAMLENLVPGWAGKIFVLALLGFAATDFVITMTLSAADATQHLIENPLVHSFLGEDWKIPLTIALLAVLAYVFIRGFKEAIELATFVCVPYLALNIVVLARAVLEVMSHPQALDSWKSALHARGDWTAILVASILLFPRLALGLSGFETGVSVMPLIRGGRLDEDPPRHRIRNTRKLLLTAALIMSVLLMLSSFVTALLIPPEAYKIGGPASGRAIAYLAHNLLGSIFGTVYDISTILILWFAGASAMAGLLHLIPRYLPRFGLAPDWSAYSRPLVLVLFTVNVAVTLVFRADVEAQGGAYATGVLVLMFSAAVAATIALARERNLIMAAYCGVVSLIFAYTLTDNVVERPDGIIIASIFILIILTISGVSRYRRARELRVSGLEFDTPGSEQMFKGMVDKKVNLVPVRGGDLASRDHVRAKIYDNFKVVGPLVFVHVELLDNRSDFMSPVQISIRKEGQEYVMDVSQAVAVANTIAYISEQLDPVGIYLGLSRKNLMQQSLRYFLFGEGETAWMLYQILLRYWEWTPEIDDVRPCIYMMSD